MKAVILAAGQATRLRPLTNHLPKCLVQINKKPILQYQIECLDKLGVRDCVIVVGFMEQKVKQSFGRKFGNVNITYVSNRHFRETNNLYSLWLAKEHLSDELLLIEGDILFGYSLLEDIKLSPYPNIAVVDRFQAHMNGTVVLPEKGLVDSMVLNSQQATDLDYRTALKTVNIYVLSLEVVQNLLIPTLDSWVAQGITNQFYEAVIAQLVRQGDLQLAIHHTGDRRWFEVDTIEDFQHAEVMVSQMG